MVCDSLGDLSQKEIKCARGLLGTTWGRLKGKAQGEAGVVLRWWCRSDIAEEGKRTEEGESDCQELLRRFQPGQLASFEPKSLVRGILQNAGMG